jgi:TonB family protein
MLSLILAAATAVADPPLPPPKVLSPLTVTAQPKTAPPADVSIQLDADDESIGGQRVSIWPASAYEERANAHVTLRCYVDVHGLAERCRVAYESPQGRGFGAAALQLQPTLKITPPKGPDGAPMAATLNIALEFKAPDPQNNLQDLEAQGGDLDSSKLILNHNPISMRRVTMMNHPVWVTAPSFDDLAKAYPGRGAGVEGYAVAHCEVTKAGAVVHCNISKEDPVGHDFAKAALSLASKFRVSAEVMKYAPHNAPIEVDIPIRLPPPSAVADRTVNAPLWLAGVDPEQAPKLFPPEAAAKGVTSGRGVAKCVVAPDGSMANCAPETADPDGLGFSQAAVKLASTMRMNLWSADAEPVEGGVVHVAIRLNLGGAN